MTGAEVRNSAGAITAKTLSSSVLFASRCWSSERVSTLKRKAWRVAGDAFGNRGVLRALGLSGCSGTPALEVAAGAPAFWRGGAAERAMLGVSE